MAHSLLNNGRSVCFQTFLRRFSSYNSNRSRAGIYSVVNNDDLNLWSENNWTEFAKQINKPANFPFPGQIGIEKTAQNNNQDIKPARACPIKKSQDKMKEENLSYLLKKPLPFDNQAIKVREASSGYMLQQTIENHLFNNNSKNLFELKAHQCPASLFKDFQSYFQLNSLSESDLTILTISFKTENDMATWNSEVDKERETLLKRFVETAQEFCSVLTSQGIWADFIDPSNGRPSKAPYGHATFYETDERFRKLGFEIVDYGCCKVISHHLWGTKTYVGCMLTTAPRESSMIKSLVDKFS